MHLMRSTDSHLANARESREKINSVQTECIRDLNTVENRAVIIMLYWSPACTLNILLIGLRQWAKMNITSAD